MKLLAFGGPWNEQVVPVEDGRPVVLVALPVAAGVPTGADAELSAVGATYRHGRYDVERVAYHDPSMCDDKLHEAGCLWDAQCLVYEGFPKQRITDALNAIIAMSTLLTVDIHGPL